MAVDSVVFPLNDVRQVGGEVLFSTDISEGLSGVEVRTPNWQDSRRRFDAMPGIRTLDHVKLVRAFHMACQGAEIGFLLRDWSDYTTTNTQDLIADGGGAYEQGVSVELTATTFQLQKLYSNGFRQHRRKITRPQSGTVTLYTSGGAAIASGYSIDYTTGVATFDAAPAGAPYWAGSFYVPVRFESDAVNWELVKYSAVTKKGHGDQPEVSLLEVRE